MNALPLRRLSPSPRRARTLRALLVSAVLGAAFAVPGVALANGDAVIQDCALDEQLSKSYTQAEYKDALAHIPGDLDQYTSCRDVIRRAQLQAAGVGGGAGGSSSGGVGGGAGGGGTGGGGGVPGVPGDGNNNGLDDVDNAIAAASPAERDALKHATAGSDPVSVGGRTISPSALTRGDLGGSSTSIPTPLLVALILLALGTAAALTPTLRTLARSRRHGPLA